MQAIWEMDGGALFYIAARKLCHNGFEKILLKDILFHLLYKLAESICIYYSSLLVRPDIFLGFGTLKKGPKYGLQTAGCKKTGSLLFKKKIDSQTSSH